jgi:hypothetical protein
MKPSPLPALRFWLPRALPSRRRTARHVPRAHPSVPDGIRLLPRGFGAASQRMASAGPPQWGANAPLGAKLERPVGQASTAGHHLRGRPRLSSAGGEPRPPSPMHPRPFQRAGSAAGSSSVGMAWQGLALRHGEVVRPVVCALGESPMKPRARERVEVRPAALSLVRSRPHVGSRAVTRCRHRIAVTFRRDWRTSQQAIDWEGGHDHLPVWRPICAP